MQSIPIWKRDPFAAGGDACASRLDSCPSKCFCDNAASTKVTVIEGSEPHGSFRINDYEDQASLLRHLHDAPQQAVRIITIAQPDSYGQLQITRTAMEGLVRVLDVSPDFLSVLSAFGDPPRDSEEGFGNAIYNEYDDGSFSISYLFRYVEKRGYSWRMRQTGMYHAYSSATDSSLWIILHPREKSEFQARLTGLASQPGTVQSLVAQPHRVHALLFASYFDNFRWWLKEIGDKFSEGVSTRSSPLEPQHVLTDRRQTKCSPLTSLKGTIIWTSVLKSFKAGEILKTK